MDAEIVIDNFTFAPTPLKVKVGTTVTWVNHDDIPHSIVCPDLKVKSHPLDTDDSNRPHVGLIADAPDFCTVGPELLDRRF